MTTTIAGMFETIEKAQGAMGELLNGNFGEKDVCSFANNSPGQHATFPVGGDEDEDPGAVHADSGAGKGAAIGLVAGAAIGAVTAGPPGAAVGAGIGAYVGSLVGALHGLEDSGTETQPARRPAGVVVAVKIQNGNAEQAGHCIWKKPTASGATASGSTSIRFPCPPLLIPPRARLGILIIVRRTSNDTQSGRQSAMEF